MPKVRCPRHADENPSCEIYPNGGFCFSGCGYIPLDELGVSGSAIEPRQKEDIDEKINYIKSLPRRTIRGFDLPFDLSAYYLLWPGDEYYKARLWEPNAKGKYRNPSGHSQPLFVAQTQGQPSRLFIVEGEFNALSLAVAFPEWSVVSPGSTGDFMNKKQEAYLQYYRQYDNIVIITDADDPGKRANIYTRILIGYQVPFVYSVFLEPDANEIHRQKGAEALREAVKKQLPERMQGTSYGRRESL